MSLASAHVTGGPLELYQGVQGNYEVWVSSRLSAPVTGIHHLNVTVLNAHTKQAVPGTHVSLTFMSPEDISKTYGVAPSTRAYAFEVDTPLEQTGQWLVSLEVQSPLGYEKAEFPLRIFTPLQISLLPLSVFAASVGSMALLGFGKFDLNLGRCKRLFNRYV